MEESTNVFRGIKLDDGDIMVILSSAGPIDIDGVNGGNSSVLIVAQMSSENVASVVRLCGIQVTDTKLSGVYMLVSKVRRSILFPLKILRLQVNGSNLYKQKT